MSELPFIIPAGQVASTARNVVVPQVVRNVTDLARTFALQNVQIIQPQKQQFNIPDNSDNPPDPGLGYKSSLGTIVLVDLTFHGQTYQDESGQIFTFPDITLEAVLINLNQTKNVVKTQIQGRKGTVKEYVGMGDYALTINAIIAGANGVYPRSDVQNMIWMMNCPNAITVTSWYLQQFNVNSIFIETYDSNQDEGQYSRQPISITAVSDEEVNLRFRP